MPISRRSMLQSCTALAATYALQPSASIVGQPAPQPQTGAGAIPATSTLVVFTGPWLFTNSSDNSELICSAPDKTNHTCSFGPWDHASTPHQPVATSDLAAIGPCKVQTSKTSAPKSTLADLMNAMTDPVLFLQGKGLTVTPDTTLAVTVRMPDNIYVDAQLLDVTYTLSGSTLSLNPKAKPYTAVILEYTADSAGQPSLSLTYTPPGTTTPTTISYNPNYDLVFTMAHAHPTDDCPTNIQHISDGLNNLVKLVQQNGVAISPILQFKATSDRFTTSGQTRIDLAEMGANGGYCTPNSPSTNADPKSIKKKTEMASAMAMPSERAQKLKPMVRTTSTCDGGGIFVCQC